MRAHDVVAALREGPFRAPAHAFLEEVRNATGAARIERYADALAISLWPSRGIWFAGVEVKVSRQDWKRELDDPRKSAAIQRFCDYWWVAAPAGIVESHEVPETWGLFVIHEGKRRGGPVEVVKPAPKIAAEGLSAAFVASVLRNHASTADEVIAAKVREAREVWEAEMADGRAAAKIEGDLRRRLAHANDQWKALEGRIAAFEKASGVRIDTWDAGQCGKRFALAQQLDQLQAQAAMMAKQLHRAGALCEEALVELQKEERR